MIEHMDRYYNEGSTYKCWGDKEVQRLRFSILSEIGDLNNKSILDVGCGLGEFYNFCKECRIIFGEYVGIDINPGIVKQVNRQSPELNISCIDIKESTLADKAFDFVIASGLFNFECADWDDRTQAIIERCFKISRIGMAVNFLRFREENRNPAAHYVKYQDILRIIEPLTDRHILRSDYKKNDFTVYLYNKQLK